MRIKTIFRDCRGLTLIELVAILIVSSIAVISLMQLMTSTLDNSHDSAILTRAITYAEEKMEVIISDKKNKGYDWVVTAGNYSSDYPGQGFTRSVTVDTTGKIYGGISYAFVKITVDHDELPVVKVSTWLTDY